MHKYLVEFFKNHNLYDDEVFKYIYNNIIYIDYYNEIDRLFIGCFFELNKNNKLRKIKLCVPFIVDDKTMLINIHEFGHAIQLYSRIGKKYVDSDLLEVLPMLLERIYISEHKSKELEDFERKLNDYDIDNKEDNNIKKYITGLELQDELMNIYRNDNLKKLERKIKKVYKRHN